MLIEDLCLKIYLWPFLSHLANIKGICQYRSSTPFPFITLPPGVTLGTTTSTTSTTTPTPIPTFQPTIPTFFPTLFPTLPPVTIPTIPTFQPTIPTLPTLFPTLPTVTIQTIPTFQPTVPSVFPTIPTTTTPTTLPTTMTTLPNSNCPIFPVICLPGGIRPDPNCPCIDPRIGLAEYTCKTPENIEGFCTIVDSCPNIIAEYYYKIQSIPSGGMTFDDFLKRLLCDWNGFNFMICCPNRGNQVQKPSTTSKPTHSNTISEVSIFQFTSLNYNNPVLPSVPDINGSANKNGLYRLPRANLAECGTSPTSQNRIVGGSEAKKGAYPWITALGYINGRSSLFLCAGSIITARHVLTCGHCVMPELSFVRLGAHNLTEIDSNTIDIKIILKIIHENYNPNLISNDIAILKLDKDIKFTSRIQPICLPIDTVRVNDIVGMNPFIAGWGAVKYQGPISNIVRDAQVPIINTEDCRKNYTTKFPTIDIGEKMICAGIGKADSCQGDSGGPLMLPLLDKNSYYYYLIGLVSYGFECSQPGFPGVYTRVSSYIKWIETHIN